MNNLEQKIRKNKPLFDQQFENKNKSSSVNLPTIKTGFSDGWDKGWGNYGKAMAIKK